MTSPFIMLIRIDAKIAAPKVICTPGTSETVSAIIAPLITRLNKPKLKIISGNERILIIGLKTVFKMEKIKPAEANSQKSFGLLTFANRLKQSHKPEADTNQCRAKFSIIRLVIMLILAYFYVLSKNDM